MADRELAGRMMAAQMAQGAMEGGGGGLADLPVEAQAPRQEPERYDLSLIHIWEENTGQLF